MHQCVCVCVYLVELYTHTCVCVWKPRGKPWVTIGTSYFQAQSLTDTLAYTCIYYTHSKKTKEKYQHYSTLQNKTEKGYSIKTILASKCKGNEKI